MRLKNILIVVKDIEKSRKFYQDLFGLDLVLDNDGNMILTEGLVLQDEKIWSKFLDRDIIQKSNSCELYFEEKDIESFVKKLESLYPNIEYVNHLMTHSWGQRVIRFYDLDGNLIEVGTPMQSTNSGNTERIRESTKLAKLGSCGMDTMKIEKLAVNDLFILTELFDYNDIEQMISECARDIQNGIIDIFVLYDKEVLVGELHVMYESDDENYAIRGRRVYMFAFRVREDFQNKGYGTYLLKTVLTALKENGYSEFTVGVEDDNFRAIHMYQALGFNEFLLRKQEEYQGDAYEYNLYLKR